MLFFLEVSIVDDRFCFVHFFDRSDGKEVMVDNSYLKAYNPLLVIDHLFA